MEGGKPGSLFMYFRFIQCALRLLAGPTDDLRKTPDYSQDTVSIFSLEHSRGITAPTR